MLMLGWINSLVVPVLLLLVSGSVSVDDWSDRYMKWTKNDEDKQYNLQLCASKDDGSLCGKFTWHYPETECSSKLECIKEKNYSEGNVMQCYTCTCADNSC